MHNYIKIHEKDNVCVALEDLKENQTIELKDGRIVLLQNISRGHKIAIKQIAAGENVIKYGAPIGYATSEIKPGEWIHTHNLKTNLGDNVSYIYEKEDSQLKQSEEDFFFGFRRDHDRVGIRNDIFIIPTVGCVNKITTLLEKIGNDLIGDNSEIKVLAFPHPYGCSQMGDDQENTREVLADLIEHPNAGGVLVIGLGCENSNIEEIKKHMKHEISPSVKFLVCQEAEDEIEEGTKILKELIQIASKQTREKVSMSELIVGVKCGGSDGLSGITANPTVGLFSDLLISKGGTTILTEVPEMFGAETLLMNRCKDKETFELMVKMINNFKDYYRKHNQVIYENPSPGNKAGGITTLEDKSLGCTQKSGSATVVDVIEYGRLVKQKGLNILSAPGNDLVASTALAASGAHLVLFTTGRGTPFAAPVPTMKIATNTYLANHKNNWIDFNCGEIVKDQSHEELAKQLYDKVKQIASGEQVKSEIAGFHDMAIFKSGVTL